MITKLILSDGTVISSGVTGAAAVASFSLTRSVNARQELTFGACCAAMAELSILGLESLSAGQELEICRTDGENTVRLGLFTAQRPVKTGKMLKLTAYDRVSWLDQDLTDWLAGLTGWPYRLYDFAAAVCTACGLELKNDRIPNGDFSVERFTAAGITGRVLMQWVGEAAGCFCRADQDGKIELGWYETRDTAFTSGGTSYYYADSLTMEDYTVAPVEKVQLSQTTADVGVVWPNAAGKLNTYRIVGNPLLAASVTEKSEKIAKALYEKLSALSYTPCQVTVPENSGVTAGDVVTVDGKTVLVMTCRLQNGRQTLECTGSPDRSDTQAVNEVSYKALSGKVLELDTRVEGLTVEHRDSAGDLARLALEVEGISTEVLAQDSRLQQRLSKVEQTAQQLTVQVEQGPEQIRTSTGYTFGADGLRIARSGTEMENRLDHTGMYVERAGQVILRANNQGVLATDVQVENYLNIGACARLEDYAGRTACFYLG